MLPAQPTISVVPINVPIFEDASDVRFMGRYHTLIHFPVAAALRKFLPGCSSSVYAQPVDEQCLALDA